MEMNTGAEREEREQAGGWPHLQSTEDGDNVAALPETLVEWCYADEYFTELSIERTGRFLEWLGVLKKGPAGGAAAMSA